MAGLFGFLHSRSILGLRRWRGRVGWRGWAVEPWEGFDFLALPWAELHKQGRSAGAIECVKCSTSRQVLRLEVPGDYVFPAPAGPAPALPVVYAKRYLINSLRRRVGNLLSGGKAGREFWLGWRLLARGVRTARPLAYGIASPGRILAPPAEKGFSAASSFLLTEELKNEGTLLEWAESGRANQTPHFYHALAIFLARMHKVGFYHDDCSGKNLCVSPGAVFRPQPKGNQGLEPFCILDIDHGRLYRRGVPMRRRLINLFQVIRSLRQSGMRTNVLRHQFVVHYLAAAALPGFLTPSDLIRGVNRIARRKLGQDLLDEPPAD